METEEEINYKGLLDRLEIVLDRMAKPRAYSWKRRKLYHRLGRKQIKHLCKQLE